MYQGRRRRMRRNVGQSFRKSCSAASALLQVPGAGYQDGFLSDCRGGTREKRERRNKGSLMEEKRGVSDPREAQRL